MGFEVPNDFGKPDETYVTGCKFDLGEACFEALETPGHSAGSSFITCKALRICFTGDTLFEDGLGETFYRGGCEEDIMNTWALIKEEFKGMEDMIIYPGHGNSATFGEAVKKRRPNIAPQYQ